MTRKMNERKEETESNSSPYFKLFLSSIATVLIAVFYSYFLGREIVPSSKEATVANFIPVPCSQASYVEEASAFPRCIPRIRCGRYVSDSLITGKEAEQLLDFTKRAMSLTPGGSGGATIYDLSSGALSYEDQFINVWSAPKSSEILAPYDFEFFEKVQKKIKDIISQLFGLSVESFYLTRPCFISRLDSKPARKINDEYWHYHIDKETYGKFIYTSLIYLSDHGKDFEGGRFIFVEEPVNTTISPKVARFVTFTSGSENPHLVERVTSGIRYALTIAFSCDPQAAIRMPTWNGRKE